MSNNEIDVDELLKRILEEEEYVKSQTLSYDEYLPEFFARAAEDLEIIEGCAIELENNQDNNDAINSMFRSFHNIKGSSGFVAQDNVQNIAHQTETLLDGCRKGLRKADKLVIDLILKSADIIKQLCEDVELNVDESYLELIYSHISALSEADKERISEIQPAEINETPVNAVNNEVINDEIWPDFINEIGSYIKNAKISLDLLKNNNNSENLNNLFKNFHSIKGLSGFAQQKILQRIAHEAEKLVNKDRNNISSDSIVILSDSISLLEEFCSNALLSQDPQFLERVCLNIQQVDYQLKYHEILDSPESAEKEEFLEDFILETTEHLQNIESNVIELEIQQDNQDIINALLRSFHAIKGLSGFANQQLIEKIAHNTESLLQSNKYNVNKNIINLILTSSDFIKKICNQSAILADKDFMKEVHLLIQAINNLENNKDEKILIELAEIVPKKIDITLIEQSVKETENVEKTVEKAKTESSDEKIEQTTVKENKLQTRDVVNTVRTQQQKPVSEDYMRIATSKVDTLVEMVGELVINQSLIEQYAISVLHADNIFLGNFNRMARITKDLQNLAMFLRLVPLKSTFQKITRVARDTINELNKNIEFSTSGDETEIDRIVTEKLLDPLVHLVKNAISHGIESTGTVKVNAYNKRGSIYIEVIDDGKGIDIDRVYQKALEKGLIDPNKNYSENEIQEFIMLPGFSTVEVANNISGRGVGMDVVKTEIQKIGGKVEIESQKGLGTKFTLKIPLNHAIMNGLIVDIEDTKYILPTVNVKQIVQPKEEDWVFTQGVCTQIKVRDKIIPVIHIKKLFGQKNEETPILVVIIEMDQKYIALPVKNVLNRQEVVIKPVSEEFSGLDFISGMSILGDGKVSLILDIESMFSK